MVAPIQALTTHTHTHTHTTHTHLREELIEYTHEITEGDTTVCNHTLNLVELGQVSSVKSLIAKHTVN